MICILSCNKTGKFYGFYNNIDILRSNLEFLSLDDFTIYKLFSNDFGMTEISIDEIKNFKTIDKKIFVIYKKSVNNFIHYSSSSDYLCKMINYFENQSDYSVIEVILNSMFVDVTNKINLKIKSEKKYTKEELIEKSEITRKLNLLKFQKKRLEEKKIEYETNLNLYNEFKKKKSETESFEIPELFAHKFIVFKQLEDNDKLSFNNYLENDPKEFIENSYELLFSGGNNVST